MVSGVTCGVAFSDNNIFNEAGYATTGYTKHTYNDWGMYLQSKEIGMPKPQTYGEQIAGRDGVLDLTETVYGSQVRYGNRTLKINLLVPDGDRAWSAALNKVNTFLHGKKKYIKFDDQPDWFYYGRCSVDSLKTSRFKGIISITCDCEPYRTERYQKVRNVTIDGKRVSDWLWDSFSFVDGYIWNNVLYTEKDADTNKYSGFQRFFIAGDNTKVYFRLQTNTKVTFYLHYYGDGWTDGQMIVDATRESMPVNEDVVVTLNRGNYVVSLENATAEALVTWHWQSKVI